MSELTSELKRMADDAARQARPPAAAEIIRQGDRRRRHSVTRQALGGLAAAGMVGGRRTEPRPDRLRAGARHGHDPDRGIHAGEQRQRHGHAEHEPAVLLEPGTLQSDLAHDGIRAKVTVGSFCSSDPAPASVAEVVSVPKIQPGQAPTVTINPAAMPAGTELSFGYFQLANGGRTFLRSSTWALGILDQHLLLSPHGTAGIGLSRRRWR